MESSSVRSATIPDAIVAGTDLGRLISNRYLLLDSIGRGGMSDVLLARDVRSGSLVALKLLAQEYRGSAQHEERMERETELLGRVSHENVVRLLDAGWSDDQVPYLVLEPLVGETLHQTLGRHGAVPLSVALPWLRAVAVGLAACHRAGVVHADVKPSNVFLCGPIDAPTDLKLIDFGLAHCLLGRFSSPGPDCIGGTFEYMAPEQILAEPVDARSDVYAFGILMYRWLTGELPFDTPIGSSLLAHHLTSPLPPLSWLLTSFDPRVERVIHRATRKDPRRRYPDMDSVIADLDRIAQGNEEIHGVELGQGQDRYEPVTDVGRRALGLLTRTHRFAEAAAAQ